MYDAIIRQKFLAADSFASEGNLVSYNKRASKVKFATM